MQCPRCARSLLALARRPASWTEPRDRGTWIGLHAGDTRGTSECRLHHDEVLALNAATTPELVERPSWPRAA